MGTIFNALIIAIMIDLCIKYVPTPSNYIHQLFLAVISVIMVAVGGGAKTDDGKIIPMDVKVGDKVLFGKWSGTEVKIDGKEFSIMKESDIMGISSK